ncbi:MAG: PAS domain S-box protein [Acidobacteria bacterium]|nr:PAS domain S-box protein [Acidobacteriota bacterium]
MEPKDTPRSDLAEELESLREEIAHLHSLILRPSPRRAGSAPDAPVRAPGDAAPERPPLPAGVVEDAPLGMALVDAEGRLMGSNRAFGLLFGYTGAELRSLPVERLGGETGLLSSLIGQVSGGVMPAVKAEGRLVRKGGDGFWSRLTVSASPEAGPKGCLLVVEDASDRTQAVRALESEKQLLGWLINSSVDGIIAFDRDGFFTVWNPAMERMFGLAAGEVLGRPAFLACPFLEELGEDANITAALEGRKSVSKGKCYTVPGGAGSVWFEGYYGPIHGPGEGEVIGGLAIVRDVTERALAEEARRASEERYRELFENAYDMVYTHDLSGKITSMNKAAERMLGYSLEEALRMRFSQLVAPESRAAARRMIDRQIADAVPMTAELDVIARDGSRLTLEVSHRLIFREGRPHGIQGIARDISERKRAEGELAAANRKLEAWVRDLEQRTREMTLLGEMGDILRACLTTEEVYEVIVRIAREIFPEEAGALYVMGPLRNIVESVAEWGDTERMATTFTPDECWALRRGRVHWVEDTGVGLLCRHLETPPPRGYLCVPMMAQSEAVGVLHLAHADGTPLGESKQRLATAMGERVAMALSNLRLHETLRNQSIRDPLTGLFNRSFMEEALELELRRAARTQGTLVVIMTALDRFQKMTEEWGLDAGDSLLCRTAALLQSRIRKGDIACRFSGHAFVLLLPHSGRDVGRRRAETLRDLVRGMDVQYPGAREGARISASVGMALFPDHGQTVEALLRSAEAAVGRARSGGGDSVVVAS